MIVDLVVIALAAVVAPVLAELVRRVGIPSVVLEIGLGILGGSAVAGLIKPDPTVSVLSNMGLSLLMFLAGYELQLSRVRGRPIMLALTGWLSSLVLAAVAAVVLVLVGMVPSAAAGSGWTGAALVGAALTTTALGTLLPVLQDSGVLSSRLGTLVMAVGSVGEFGPIVLVAVVFSRIHPATTVLLLIVFAVLALLAGLISLRPWPVRVERLLEVSLHNSSQLMVRVGVLVVIGLTYVAATLGLDVLMGAFAAGIVLRLAVTRHAVPEAAGLFRAKLEGIGFGFFVPIFFIVSGTRLPVVVFAQDPSLLLRIPIYLGLFLLVRGLPVLLLYRSTPVRQRWALVLFSATGLPLIVVITAIGTDAGTMSAGNAAALVGAGIVSVILLPTIGLRVAGDVATTTDVSADELPSPEGL